MESQNKNSFNEVKLRLDQIVEAISEDDISLDDALGLYEEAVKLGMQATTLLEEDIEQSEIDEGVAAIEASELDAAEQAESQSELADSSPDVEASENVEASSQPEESSNGFAESTQAEVEAESHE
ncbi:MAG: exodeoxyribonuclease VII small subunit [Raoultibacter sp.]